MVCGLVEEQEVGLHDQEPSQMRAHHPSSAQFLGGAIPVGLAETETFEHFLCFGVRAWVAERLVHGVGFKIVWAIDDALSFKFSEFFFQSLHLASATR